MNRKTGTYLGLGLGLPALLALGILAVMLALGMFGASNVSAGTQAFTAVANPATTGVAPGPIAVANDGTIFAGVGNTGIQISTDGGDSFGAVIALPNIETPIMIVPAPDFGTSRVVAALSTGAGGVGTQLSISVNGGTTWTAASADGVIGAAADVPRSLAISPNFTGSGGGVFAIGVDPGAAAASVFHLTLAAGGVTAANIARLGGGRDEAPYCRCP